MSKKKKWTIKKSPYLNQLRIEPTIATVYGSGDELWEHARIIRAAPELYDIILDIAGYKLLDGEYPLEAEILNKMADVMAKIRGEE